MSQAAYEKHLPIVDGDSEGFWEGCRAGALRLQCCLSCGSYRYAPKRLCPSCWSTEFEWRAVSGRGEVYTFTVEHHAYHPSWKEDVPYVIAVIQLEEGPRMTSRIVGCGPEDVRVDLPVQVTFDKATEDISLPLFEPSGEGDGSRVSAQTMGSPS